MPARPTSKETVTPADALGSREAKVTKVRNPLKRALLVLGPGLITGASDDDPSGIGTYAVAGATLGYSTLWLTWFTLPMMAAVQFTCSKIGLITGKGLAAVMRERYPRWLVLILVGMLVVANTINAGADIGAIAGSINLLVPIKPIALVLPVAVGLLVMQIWGSYRVIAGIFRWLTLALFAYLGAALFAHPNPWAVLHGTFVPTLSLDPGFISTLVAILGTTISPYMFFWQANLEVEEDKALGRRFLWQRQGTTDKEVKYAALDVNAGMVFSQVVMYFIILATAATLFASGHHNIQTAADAAKALVPFAGKFSELLLALGLAGAGILAVPILTASSAYALSEGFGWKAGLDEHPGRAPQFYVIIALSTLVGLELNFMGIGQVAALFWTAVINGVLAPILLVFIFLLGSDKRVMGERVNGPLITAIGWITIGSMAAAAIAMFALWGKT